MNFDMTKPCDNCPFRREGGIRLTDERVIEIAESDGEFPCHKTTVDDGNGELVETEKSAHCAGFLIFREKTNTPSQMMRICERLGMYDARKFVENEAADEIFDSIDEMLDAQLA